jgi:carbonic anhydrase
MSISRRAFVFGVPAAATVGAAIPAEATGRPPYQSPIAIRSRDAVPAPGLPALRIEYPHSAELTLRYVSRDGVCTERGEEEVVQADVPAAVAYVRLGATRYELVQYHFHTPSEHTLDGRHYSVEQHFVHRGPAGETLVLGLFLVPGGHRDQVPRHLPEECGAVLAITVDLAAFVPRNLSTFRYQGSLTTAPYSEPVSWLVFQHAQAVAAAGTVAYRRLFPHGNAREVQPLNGRRVSYRRQ